MTSSSFADTINQSQLPCYDQSGEVQDRWQELLDAAAEPDRDLLSGMAEDSAFRQMLDGVFQHSPYLFRSCLKESALLASLLHRNLDELFNQVMDDLEQSAANAMPQAEMARLLRHTKRKAALLIAFGDISGIWPLKTVTNNLTLVADRTVHHAFGQLLREAAAKGDLVLPNPEDPCAGSGLVVIAMGKMGAGELNYSSDIDLIVLYDQEVIDYHGRKSPTDFYSRITRNMVRLMQDLTADGYVFRTDLRLRPDPAASPLALSMAAAENYYEALGQNWERAAMIKARACAGDLDAGNLFLDRLKPFVWRKFLDFAAINDIHSIKRQINSHKGHNDIAIAGHDIKVGRGGIREIEFFAQTQQLIAGGRHPDLRNRTTIGALRSLATSDRIEGRVLDDMKASYEYLRRVEHRLQMLDDAQTQKLPAEDEGLLRLARFLGYEDTSSFSRDLVRHMKQVEEHYAALFEDEEPLTGDGGNLVFTGTDPDPGTVKTLAEMGYRTPEGVIQTVRGWHHGRYRATASTRARELLTELVPELLRAVSQTQSPDMALGSFDAMLKALPAGVQVLSLFRANPGLLRLLARVLGTAPRLAERLGRNAGLIDCLLEQGGDELLDQDQHRVFVDVELSKARDYQDVLDAVRRYANDTRFRIGVQVIENNIDTETANRALSYTAETCLHALLPRVIDDVATRHGYIRDAGMAVIGLGRLGARELTFGSDLDLIFIYDDRPGAILSDGDKQIPSGPYFTKVSQRFITSITSLTPAGSLYEVDMRLRPSGNSGAVAVPLSGYRSYMLQDAWTWEHMALTRARVIMGPDSLKEALGEVISDTLRLTRDTETLRNSVAEMRNLIEQEKAIDDPWRIKQVRGGLVDVDFIVQTLLLANAAEMPGILSPSTPGAIETLRQHEFLTDDHAATLRGGYRYQQSVRGVLKLCYRSDFDEATASPDFRHTLMQAMNRDSFAEIRSELTDWQKQIDELFRHYVGGR